MWYVMVCSHNGPFHAVVPPGFVFPRDHAGLDRGSYTCRTIVQWVGVVVESRIVGTYPTTIPPDTLMIDLHRFRSTYGPQRKRDSFSQAVAVAGGCARACWRCPQSSRRWAAGWCASPLTVASPHCSTLCSSRVQLHCLATACTIPSPWCATMSSWGPSMRWGCAAICSMPTCSTSHGRSWDQRASHWIHLRLFGRGTWHDGGSGGERTRCCNFFQLQHHPLHPPPTGCAPCLTPPCRHCHPQWYFQQYHQV